MKIKFLMLAFILAAAFSVVCGQAESKNAPALRALVKHMSDAQLAFDAKALDEIFTSDYIEISPAGEFDPREKVLGFYKPELKPPADAMPRTIDLSEFSIREYGSFAVVIAKFGFSAIVDGKPTPPRSMRATIVCRREKNEWKIASTQYTGIRPPQQQPQKAS